MEILIIHVEICAVGKRSAPSERDKVEKGENALAISVEFTVNTVIFVCANVFLVECQE